MTEQQTAAPARPVRGVEYDPDYPDTKAGWRRRLREKEGLDPDEKLGTRGVAAELTRLRRGPNGKQYGTDTVLLYLSTGAMPVPAVQEGGREPGPDDLILVRGRSPARYRKPRKGEKVGGVRYRAWYRWQVWQFESQRRGPGWWSSEVNTRPEPSDPHGPDNE